MHFRFACYQNPKNGRDRCAILLEELTEEDIAAIAGSEMDPRHDHLNEEVRGWQP